mmetsp:Transcript_19132/g.53344  ORF Transcript_19132/g.53344 Transcript_19132/m.53344 type:complete len:100 (-) Transcript_19132:1504-1803(-)
MGNTSSGGKGGGGGPKGADLRRMEAKLTPEELRAVKEVHGSLAAAPDGPKKALQRRLYLEAYPTLSGKLVDIAFSPSAGMQSLSVSVGILCMCGLPGSR